MHGQLEQPPHRVWPWRFLAAGLVLAAAAGRVAYLCSPHALDLAPDEAHYWDWSRHLDWSYYSKGPVVAYLIRLSCELAGGSSEALVGNAMLAVRLPAILCGSLLLASLYVLTVQTTGREPLAAAVVACALTLPLVTAGSTLMTIDAPYTCCWGWALVLGRHALFAQARWAWPATGLVVGVGILAKYTMVLWLPSLALYLLFSPSHRSLLWSRGFWGMTLIAGACCLPILGWNVQHDWVTLRHVGGQAGVQASGWRPFGPVVYVAEQAAVLLGFWFVPWAAGLLVYRPSKTGEGQPYLWWMAVPMFAVFGLFSFRTTIEPNWPVTAYLSGGVLGAVWLERHLHSPVNWFRRLTRVSLGLAVGLGLTLNLFLYYSPAAYPWLAAAAGPPSEQRPYPLRRFDPTCRLRGWRELADAVNRHRDALRAQNIEPILAGTHWTVPGALSFYSADQPTVYSLGRALGDRHSQYDQWRPNPLSDAAAFQGRTFLCVGDPAPALYALFERVEPPQRMVHHVAGYPVAGWLVTVCHGYRGPPAASAGSDRY